jgi:hypothetical protein
MTIKALVTKGRSGLVAATETDREIISKIKYGQSYRVELIAQSQRSVQHHRLFFAMLQLTLEYWQPKTNFVTTAETQALKRFIEWCEKETGEQGAIRNLAREYFRELSNSRSKKITVPPKSIESLLEWLKMKVGHCEYFQTPSGLNIRTKSINFNSMSQSDFDVFYKDSFRVCWTEIMSQHFETEAEMQNVIDQMAGFA